jgi:hypothetical protein
MGTTFRETILTEETLGAIHGWRENAAKKTAAKTKSKNRSVGHRLGGIVGLNKEKDAEGHVRDFELLAHHTQPHGHAHHQQHPHQQHPNGNCINQLYQFLSSRVIFLKLFSTSPSSQHDPSLPNSVLILFICAFYLCSLKLLTVHMVVADESHNVEIRQAPFVIRQAREPSNSREHDNEPQVPPKAASSKPSAFSSITKLALEKEREKGRDPGNTQSNDVP